MTSTEEIIFTIVLFISVALALVLCIWCERIKERRINELADKADIDQDLAYFIY